MRGIVVEELRQLIERREFELSALKTSLEIIEREPESRNGGPPPLPSVRRSPVKKEGTLRKRVLKLLEGRGPSVSVTTDELMQELGVENRESFRANLRLMAEDGKILKLPIADNWRMAT